jgi:hypothetical protein
MWARFKDHCDYDYRCACASLNTTTNTKDLMGLHHAVAADREPVPIFAFALQAAFSCLTYSFVVKKNIDLDASMLIIVANCLNIRPYSGDEDEEKPAPPIVVLLFDCFGPAPSRGPFCSWPIYKHTGSDGCRWRR